MALKLEGKRLLRAVAFSPILAGLFIDSVINKVAAVKLEAMAQEEPIAKGASLVMTEGLKLMQNAFLDKQKAAGTNQPLELAQTDPQQTLEAAGDKVLQDIYQTKFIAMGSEWTVFDWTIFVLVIAVLVVASIIFLLFCCCISGDAKEEQMSAY